MDAAFGMGLAYVCHRLIVNNLRTSGTMNGQALLGPRFAEGVALKTHEKILRQIPQIRLSILFAVLGVLLFWLERDRGKPCLLLMCFAPATSSALAFWSGFL